ncbi:MAG: C40 family peptidase [Bacteroidales bacterium]
MYSKLLVRALAMPVALLIISTGCKKKMSGYFRNEIDSISITWVPDFREGVFDVKLYETDKGLVLKGETDVPQAREAVVEFLKSKNVSFADSLVLLPDKKVITKPWGLVDVSVCNIRASSSNEVEMVTQALMGTPVRILKKESGWFLIQTPDKYIGWVDSDAVTSMAEQDMANWKSSPRLFYLKKTGDVLADPNSGRVVSDIVCGCIVVRKGDGGSLSEVILPDGRTGFIRKEDAIPLSELTTGRFLSAGNLIRTAESFMGIPYLWGGTSSKGFDCSGFVKTVYYLNGLILSRDASQQFGYGTRIRRSFYPDSLKAGDLLFFGPPGRGRPRATHVGMYIGNTEFIHASGMVRISSLDSTRSNFRRFRRDTFIGVRRIIGAEPGKGLQPVSSHDWYY